MRKTWKEKRVSQKKNRCPGSVRKEREVSVFIFDGNEEKRKDLPRLKTDYLDWERERYVVPENQDLGFLTAPRSSQTCV